MKKIITILFVTMLMGLSASAKKTVVFKGETATQTWNVNCVIDKTSFANVSAGNRLYVKWELDTEYAASKSEDYYQVTVQDGNWTKIVNSYDAKRVFCYTYTLTAADVTNFQTYGMVLSGRNVKFTDVEISDGEAISEIECWETGSWTTAPTTNITFPDSWGSTSLNNADLKDCKKGDMIVITFTPATVDADWKAKLQICIAPEGGGAWTQIIEDYVAYKTTLSLIVDETNLSNITTGDIRLNGNNVTITSVALEKADPTYSLNAANNQIDLSAINGQTVNVELTRKFDWNGTICLPFDLANLDLLPDGCKVYEYKEYNSGLVFTEREHITAGVPYYMIRPYDADLTEEQKYSTISFENVTINTELNDSETSGGLTFKGNFTAGIDMEGKYGVAYSEGWGFFKGGTNTKLNAFSAYFDGTLSREARLTIILDDETTAINTVNREEIEDGSVYNLAGQRIVNPSKGLYIINKKKMIFK